MKTTFLYGSTKTKLALCCEASATFSGKSADVRAADGSIKKVSLEKATYDNEQVVHMMRRLPLALGYKASFDVITTLGGGAVLPITAEVTKEEEVDVPAGKFKAYKVELSVQQNFWYSADEHRYLVKMEAGGTIGELVEVQHAAEGQPRIYKNDESAFSLSVPAGWYFYDGGPGDTKDRVRVAILDPEAKAHCALFAQPRTTLSSEGRDSLKAWAEERAKGGSQEAADFKVRSDSWIDMTVSGLPAISFVADFTDSTSKKAKVHYSLVVFTDKTAANFFLMTDADAFESAKAGFDQVIGSFIAR